MRLFDTKQEAIEYVNAFYNARYDLSHAEAGRPLLIIRKVNKQNKWKIKVVHQYYLGTFNRKKDFFV